MIVLTKEERQKFAAWLHQEVATDKMLTEQMGKLGIGMAMLIDRKKAEVAAKMFVAKLLESIEEQVIHGGLRPSGQTDEVVG